MVNWNKANLTNLIAAISPVNVFGLCDAAQKSQVPQNKFVN